MHRHGLPHRLKQQLQQRRPDPVNEPVAATATAVAALDALRARGAQRLDPVRWALLEALARRAQAHEGQARQLLEARLNALLSAYESACPPNAQASPKPAAATPAARPMTELRAHLAQHATPPGTELKTLRYFRQTWSRIQVGLRLTQALAKEPEKAGPINSHGLVLRALKQMREASPDYLERYVAYVDALLALDTACGGSALLPRDVLRTQAEMANPAKPGSRRSRAVAKPAVKTTLAAISKTPRK